MKSSRVLVSILCLISAVMLGHHAFAEANRLTLTGSSTVAPLVNEIAKRFEKNNPGVRVDVQSGGSGRGLADARSGIADIGMVSRAMKADESDLLSYSIALDGIGLIVHKKNAIASLTDQQIRDIFTGRISNWKEVGGEDRRITVVNKAEGRSTLELFLAHFKLKNSDIKAHIVIGENQQGIKTVAGNSGAIGYVSIGAAEFEEKNGATVRLLSMTGISASVENLKTGRFPLSRPLNLVTKGKPTGLAERFIKFSQSKEVEDIINAQFFVAPARR